MNLLELFVEIGVNDKASGAVGAIADKLGNGLATAAKIGTAAVAAAATGISALTKSAVDNFAEYEQLVGGVDTLFKESSQRIQQYADEAYKTAGVSANDYMSTVTSFAASLIQSLGGDTEKAAEYANTALTDMSDNANKMGTDMSMIQNAYQGFAKQNYTMLDNLKLGFGGTAGEMARLINSTGLLNKQLPETGKGINEAIEAAGGFSLVVEAIHKVQTEMGISGLTVEEAAEAVANGIMTEEEAFDALGTTAKEASTTIQGSVSSMKSAWQNLLTGLASGDKDIADLTSRFAESFDTVLENVLPRIEITLDGVSDLIEKAAPLIIERFPSIASRIIEGLLTNATTIVEAINDVLPELIESIVPIIVDQAPKIIRAGIDLMSALVGGFVNAITNEDNASAVGEMVFEIAQILVDNAVNMLPKAIEFIGLLAEMFLEPDSMQAFLNAAFSMVETLGNALIDSIPLLLDVTLRIVDYLANGLLEEDNLNKLLDVSLQIVVRLIEGLSNAAPKLADAAMKIIEQLILFLLNPENLMKILTAAYDIMESLRDAIIGSADEIEKGANKIVDKLWDTLANVDWKKLGIDILNTFWTGLKSTWNDLVTWLENKVNNTYNGIASMWNKINNLWGGPDLKMDIADFSAAKVDENTPLISSVGTSGVASGAIGGVVINQNIYSKAQSAADLAEESLYEARRAYVQNFELGVVG